MMEGLPEAGEVAGTAGSPTPTDAPVVAASDAIVLEVDHLVVEFTRGRQTVQAVSDISFVVKRGETLGLVGESGCGKSTTARALIQVQPLTSGGVRLLDQELSTLSGRQLRQLRTKMQIIFQDPISSLNPRRKVKDIVAEPLVIWGRGAKSERLDKVRRMLESVGVDPDAIGERRAGELSGGQCQRISIARALMAEPDLLICDEPVAALDVSIQAQMLNLLADLKDTLGLTMVFIAHDLAVVKHVSDRVAVMYLGKLVEVCGPDELYRSPAHPYTEALLASIPVPVPEPRPTPGRSTVPRAVAGALPSNLHPPSGCRFRTRCPYAQDKCADEEPPLREVAPDHQVACHFPLTAVEAALIVPAPKDLSFPSGTTALSSASTPGDHAATPGRPVERELE
jgi:peptide/nickel transport system ATP-binding protein